MPNPAIDRLRRIGKLEGISYLLLLLVAMPLKYLAGLPVAVKITGSVHGGLFLWFCLVLFQAWRAGLSWKWSALAFLASLLPFGPFVIDRRLAGASSSNPPRD